MDALHQITKESWLTDFRFLLAGVLGGGTEDAQQARLTDHLEVRYSSDLVPIAFRALSSSYNFTAKHWDYFQEIGIIQKDEAGRIAVTNALIYALYDAAMATPSPELLVKIDPIKIVRIAKKYINEEKRDKA